MRSLQLQAALAAFVEQAAAHLHADVAAGQEVPFDLETRTARMRGASLYCYSPRTDVFIAERYADLRRLDAYAAAAVQLERCETLERYLLARGVEAPRRGERHIDAALLALLQDVFEEQTDFDPSWLAQHPERLERALERLDGSSLPRAGEVTLVATLHGLAIASPEIALTRGLSIARPEALQGAPDAALRARHDRGSERGSDRGSERDGHLLVVYTAQDAPSGAEGVAEGAEVVRELLRALRLFGDGRIALGARAWARVGDGQWSTLALGSGRHPHGILLVSAEQEDELRAFCNLVSRRTDRRSTGSTIGQHATPIAWALRRFELGCDRACEYEGLSDHLLALRALLGVPSELEPQGAPEGLLAGRLAALCAPPERHAELAERTLAAIKLERAAIAGAAVQRAGGLAIARDLADHLRALLRDVICGHLRPELAELADEILLRDDNPEEEQLDLLTGPDGRIGAADKDAPTVVCWPERGCERSECLPASALEGERTQSGAPRRPSGEQELGDEADSREVLRVAV